MARWLRALSVGSVVVVAVLTLGINDWEMPKEAIPIILVFGPHVGLVLAALTSVTRGPYVAVIIAASLAGLIGIPALRSARTFGEAGAPMIVFVFLVEGLVSILILVFAVFRRPRPTATASPDSAHPATKT
jgi:hypothetical protein